MYLRRKKIYFENDRFYEYCICIMVAIFSFRFRKKNSKIKFKIFLLNLGRWSVCK